MSILETFPTLSTEQQNFHHRAYRKALREQLTIGNYEKVLESLSHSFHPLWDYSTQKAYHNLLAKAVQLIDISQNIYTPIRLAIAGSKTYSQLAESLELNLLKLGYMSIVHEIRFGAFRQAIFDASSDLYQFQPDFLLILTDSSDILHLPVLLDEKVDVEQLLQAELNEWHNLWEFFGQQSKATIIQNNFDLPNQRILGNYEHQIPTSQLMFVQQLNINLSRMLRKNVLLHDLNYLTSYYGKRQWYDPRFDHYSKQACSFEVLPHYAYSLRQLIAAQTGKMKKCLVLDLDNTLWGGVIGDDGLDGIKIGEGTPEGEAFLAFQQYAKSLKDIGIILAVCSKNKLETALEPFEKLDDMFLKRDDFVAFVANWNPKSENIRQIAQELNIGLDSIVFFDDNPAERAIVREYLPEVSVPEVPVDPAYYVRCLVEANYFETVAFSQEDRQRTRMYQTSSERKILESSATSISDFLERLEMVAYVQSFKDENMERISQLILRSNQFNLTTRRHTATTLRKFADSPNTITRSIRLTDRFGDNGLISVFIAFIEGENLVIDTWLMSCRVLERGVEQMLHNHILDIAQEYQLKSIIGHYIPTAKNELVRNHYQKLGYIENSTLDDSTIVWTLIPSDNKRFTTAIEVVTD